MCMHGGVSVHVRVGIGYGVLSMGTNGVSPTDAEASLRRMSCASVGHEARLGVVVEGRLYRIPFSN